MEKCTLFTFLMIDEFNLGVLAILLALIPGFAAIFLETWNKEKRRPTGWGWMLFFVIVLSYPVQVQNHRDQEKLFSTLDKNVNDVKSYAETTKTSVGIISSNMDTIETLMKFTHFHTVENLEREVKTPIKDTGIRIKITKLTKDRINLVVEPNDTNRNLNASGSLVWGEPFMFPFRTHEYYVVAEKQTSKTGKIKIYRRPLSIGKINE